MTSPSTHKIPERRASELWVLAYPTKAPDRTTALKIPSPWSGDEHDPIPWTYWPWFGLYQASRRVRHWIRLHDWNKPRTQCTWCGRSWCA